MQSTFKLKTPMIEVELSSSEQHVLDQTASLMEYVRSYIVSAAEAPAVHVVDPITPKSQSVVGISTIAQKLGSKSGSDLVTAACLSITGPQKETCTRAEILLEMKRAKAYFKDSFGSNLSNYLNTLIKDGTLLDQGGDTYAVAAAARSELESKLV